MAAVEGVDEGVSVRPAGLGRAFGAQLGSTGLANLADGILGTIAPLIAVGLTSSPLQVSLISAAGWLPWLLLGLVAGVVVDRHDRKRVQIVALVARASVLALAGLAAAVGILTMPVLLAVVLVYGVTEVFADLAATSIVPQLVPSERLEAANGRIVGVQQVANAFLGAPVGGVLLIAGAVFGFGASGALAGLAALMLWWGMRGSYRPASAGGTSAPAPTWSQVRDGVRYLFGHRVLRPLVITGSVLNFAMTGYFSVFVLWAVGPTSAIGLTPAQFPLLMLGFALGAVAGSLAVEAVRRRFAEVPTIVFTLVASMALMVVPVWWPNPWLTAADLVIIGVLNTVGNVVAQSMRQRLVPEDLQGRVSGASKTMAFGLMPLGALAGGVVAESFGLASAFIGAVVISLVACAYLMVALAGGASKWSEES